MKNSNKFKLPIIFIILAVALTAGCNKNDNVLGPLNSQVSFQISQQYGLNGGVEFLFKPSEDTKISRIISIYPAQQFADTLSSGNVNYVYSKDTVYIINEYSGVQTGQQWNFNFTGTTPGQNSSGYNVTSNYTVQ